jgi:hypothetical protein
MYVLHCTELILVEESGLQDVATGLEVHIIVHSDLGIIELGCLPEQVRELLLNLDDLWVLGHAVR